MLTAHGAPLLWTGIFFVLIHIFVLTRLIPRVLLLLLNFVLLTFMIKDLICRLSRQPDFASLEIQKARSARLICRIKLIGTFVRSASAAPSALIVLILVLAISLLQTRIFSLWVIVSGWNTAIRLTGRSLIVTVFGVVSPNVLQARHASTFARLKQVCARMLFATSALGTCGIFCLIIVTNGVLALLVVRLIVLCIVVCGVWHLHRGKTTLRRNSCGGGGGEQLVCMLQQSMELARCSAPGGMWLAGVDQRWRWSMRHD
jgi:hypothetical protein